MENVFIKSDHRSLDFSQRDDNDFSLSDDEGTIDAADSMSEESNQAVGNGRKRSSSVEYPHHQNEWPRSPVNEEASIDRKSLAKIITPDRQPSFFACPQMTDLQLQIEQTALRFHKYMRRSDETRSFVRRPVGAEETVSKSIHSFERSQEYREVRLQVYHMLQTTTMPFIDRCEGVDGRLISCMQDL